MEIVPATSKKAWTGSTGPDPVPVIISEAKTSSVPTTDVLGEERVQDTGKFRRAG